MEAFARNRGDREGELALGGGRLFVGGVFLYTAVSIFVWKRP